MRAGLLTVLSVCGLVISSAVAAPDAAGRTSGRSQRPDVASSEPAALPAKCTSRPAASMPSLNLIKVRSLIRQMSHRDPVIAADATVKLKMLAKEGVPVWQALKPDDPPSVRGLLTWLRDHPGNIHHPSPLRLQWEVMGVLIEDEKTGKVRLMGNADLIQYAELAREMIRDGDPYGYWAIIDVALTAMDVLGKGADHVTLPYVMPYLDRHLNLHVLRQSLRDWKGYWAKPITKPRPYPHPAYADLPLKPAPPAAPWVLPTRALLKALDRYREVLRQRGLWLDPEWEQRFTSRTDTQTLLKALATESFPVRQHVYRLLRARLNDPAVRAEVRKAVDAGHPRAMLLSRILRFTEHLVYGEKLRAVWPKELDEQCPGLLDDLLSPIPRRYFEGQYVLTRTLLYWPDRDWANRTAVKIFEALGAGKTALSIAILKTVDNAYGISVLLKTLREGDIPPAAYRTLDQWLQQAAKKFRSECADRDLAEAMLRISTSDIPTTQPNWAKVLRLAYDFVWWRLNADKLVWNEKKHRFEVPEDKLVHPTTEQIMEAYRNYGETIRSYLQEMRKRARSPRPVDRTAVQRSIRKPK